jgi:hypothetical protein
MSRLWALADLKAANRRLQNAIRFGNALVLSQMFEPRVGSESLNESPFLGGIFKYAPVVRAVSTALAGVSYKRV